jgi:bacteriocin-like protein
METIKSVCDFQELNQSEMATISGGVFWYIVGGLVIAMAKEVMHDWDNFKAGLSGQPEIKSW